MHNCGNHPHPTTPSFATPFLRKSPAISKYHEAIGSPLQRTYSPQLTQTLQPFAPSQWGIIPAIPQPKHPPNPNNFCRKSPPNSGNHLHTSHREQTTTPIHPPRHKITTQHRKGRGSTQSNHPKCNPLSNQRTANKPRNALLKRVLRAFVTNKVKVSLFLSIFDLT